MKRWLFTGILFFFALILTTPLTAQDTFPPAQIDKDEGGAVFITGQANYTFPYFRLFLPQPYILLFDIAGLVERNAEFIPSEQSQVFGLITTDPFVSPFKYELSLPIIPRGELRDVDNDGEQDAGVMIFTLAVASNTWADPYIEERDGFVVGILNSAQISTEPDTFLDITEGRLIIYAPDENQGFPNGFGADGVLFTPDDPIVSIPKGYTVANINTDPFTFDRSAEPVVDLVEAEDAELDDFSTLGWVEAYDAMLDLLRREYAFTEYKQLDWDTLDSVIRPRIETAASSNDLDAYRLALSDLALLIPDGHVSGPTNQQNFFDAVSGGLGLTLRQLDDGRVLVNYLKPGGPADLAGIKLRAEVLEINGMQVEEALEKTQLWNSYSTPHSRRLAQVQYVVRFPIGEQVTFRVQNPGNEPQELNLTAIQDFDTLQNSGFAEPPSDTALPVEFEIMDNGFGLIKIYSFSDDLPLTVNLWERALEFAINSGIPGLVIDMRQNGGGSAYLGDQLPAYFFDDEYVIGNSAVYSTDRQEFFVMPGLQDEFVLPTNGLLYNGEVAVLISPDCASACESFAWAMSINQRAAIVGHYPTAGLGGSVVPIAMPEGLTFSYTNTRSLDSEGNINIEGIGVIPSVRVPVTEETLFGNNDAVLQAGVDYLYDALNFTNLGDTVEGTVSDRYHVPLEEGDEFSIYVEGDTQVRLYVPGLIEPILEDVNGGDASFEGLRSPGEFLLAIDVEATSSYTLRITSP